MKKTLKRKICFLVVFALLLTTLTIHNNSKANTNTTTFISNDPFIDSITVEYTDHFLRFYFTNYSFTFSYNNIIDYACFDKNGTLWVEASTDYSSDELFLVSYPIEKYDMSLLNYVSGNLCSPSPDSNYVDSYISKDGSKIALPDLDEVKNFIQSIKPPTTPKPLDTPNPTDEPEPSISASSPGAIVSTDTPSSTDEPDSSVPTSPPSTIMPSVTPNVTDTPEPSNTPAPTDTLVPSNTPAPTDTSVSSNTPNTTKFPVSSSTPKPSNTITKYAKVKISNNTYNLLNSKNKVVKSAKFNKKTGILVYNGKKIKKVKSVYFTKKGNIVYLTKNNTAYYLIGKKSKLIKKSVSSVKTKNKFATSLLLKNKKLVKLKKNKKELSR